MVEGEAKGQTIEKGTRGFSEFWDSSTALTILRFQGEVCGYIQG